MFYLKTFNKESLISGNWKKIKSCFDSIHLMGRNMLEYIEKLFFKDKGNLTQYSLKRFIFFEKIEFSLL